MSNSIQDNFEHLIGKVFMGGYSRVDIIMRLMRRLTFAELKELMTKFDKTYNLSLSVKAKPPEKDELVPNGKSLLRLD